MTADTSWYGQQTLVHPDYSHQPYTAYGDPHAGQEQYGYATHGDPYAPYAQPYAGVHQTQPSYQHGGWPEYYPQQPEPTLVAEYAGYTPHTSHPGDAGYYGYPDYGYSAYETVTDVSFPVVPEQIPWDLAATTSLPEFETAGFPDATEAFWAGAEAEPAVVPEPQARAEAEPAPAPAADPDEGWTARSSRRRPARRRSAVLTIAVPSVAVLGVAGAAATTIGPLRAHHTATTASADTSAQAKAQALSAQETRDAAERAARDQARTALQLRNAAARKTAAEAPVYTLPIAYHTGLSALFGQAGTHWMQLHTGIDFPVPEGTPVHAVTGGTITTEWNPFYGYMVKLTAPDGTVTWYCHLSSYRVRSGHVKVGDIIAYSGDTGNSTGPHLHFEVHPDGGPAVDPLPWLLARGLDPR
ncbi:murein DD-endopeptidase MepM/ murein hydrolase activator NlpD [Streptacidiphilus sp. MAP12-33]|uniref:M23 family metallopeptidase n=1 Tax=Streptacidiphilus sp. MAP12-33 TaxID=3156266 RepID=UPI0035122CDD